MLPIESSKQGSNGGGGGGGTDHEKEGACLGWWGVLSINEFGAALS